MMVLVGVGAVMSMPKIIGMLTGTKLHILIGFGIKSPVSGWIEDPTMIYACLSESISC